MANMKDGGTAFPVYAHEGAVEPGMTLLDHFAGQSLMGLLSREQDDDWISYMIENTSYAHVAYHLAATMLAEKEKLNA
jgi:hypothetical protein